MFRIAFLVTRSDTIGGSHIHVRDMALALKKDGHHVSLLIGGNGPIVDYYRSYGLHPVIISNLKRNISPWNDYLACRQIKKELKKIRPDLVSTHSSKAGFLGRIAAKNAGIPVLFTAHGWSFTTGKKRVSRFLFKRLENWVAPITDKIITVSEYDKKIALDHLSVSGDRIITIHNGMMDIGEKYVANAGGTSPVNIVKIARFDNQKDHMELLNAIHTIENIHLHLIGDGPLMEDIKRLAKELNCFDNITFWGRLDSVDEVLSKCQIFTLISNWEGFPRSTLEAMRAGLPTVVSDVGGAAEAVEHGVTGFVAEKGNIDGLRTYLSELVNDTEKRISMGQMARKRYIQNYTFEHMYKKTLDVYHAILDQ